MSLRTKFPIWKTVGVLARRIAEMDKVRDILRSWHSNNYEDKLRARLRRFANVKSATLSVSDDMTMVRVLVVIASQGRSATETAEIICRILGSELTELPVMTEKPIAKTTWHSMPIDFYTVIR